MFDDIGTVFGNALITLLIVCAVSVPLGLWKLIELIGWGVSHVSLSVH